MSGDSTRLTLALTGRPSLSGLFFFVASAMDNAASTGTRRRFPGELQYARVAEAIRSSLKLDGQFPIGSKVHLPWDSRTATIASNIFIGRGLQLEIMVEECGHSLPLRLLNKVAHD